MLHVRYTSLVLSGVRMTVTTHQLLEQFVSSYIFVPLPTFSLGSQNRLIMKNMNEAVATVR